MFKSRAWNIQVTAANVVHGLVINVKRAVGVFDRAVCGQNGIVGFRNRSGSFLGWADREFKLGLAAIHMGDMLQ